MGCLKALGTKLHVHFSLLLSVTSCQHHAGYMHNLYAQA